jgi:hypothetical protein
MESKYDKIACTKYYNNNRELVNAKTKLRRAYQKFAETNMVFAEHVTHDEKLKLIREYANKSFTDFMATKPSTKEIMEESEKTIKHVKQQNKRRKNKRNWYTANREHCIAYSAAYRKAAKNLESEGITKDDPKFRTALKTKIAEEYNDCLTDEHRPYKEQSVVRVRIKDEPAEVPVAEVESTTANADTIITIAGDVNIEPKITVHMDEPNIVQTKQPSEFTIMFKDGQFIAFIISIITVLLMLTFMFTSK